MNLPACDHSDLEGNFRRSNLTQTLTKRCKNKQRVLQEERVKEEKACSSRGGLMNYFITCMHWPIQNKCVLENTSSQKSRHTEREKADTGGVRVKS